MKREKTLGVDFSRNQCTTEQQWHLLVFSNPNLSLSPSFLLLYLLSPAPHVQLSISLNDWCFIQHRNRKRQRIRGIMAMIGKVKSGCSTTAVRSRGYKPNVHNLHWSRGKKEGKWIKLNVNTYAGIEKLVRRKEIQQLWGHLCFCVLCACVCVWKRERGRGSGASDKSGQSVCNPLESSDKQLNYVTIMFVFLHLYVIVT